MAIHQEFVTSSVETDYQVVGSVSWEVILSSGIPQSLNIGAILILLFMNDIVYCFENFYCLLYYFTILQYRLVTVSQAIYVNRVQNQYCINNEQKELL